MKYRNKEIGELSDEELTEAQMSMWASGDFYERRVASPQYKERMQNQPLPTRNPRFDELKFALEAEMKRRNLNIIGKNEEQKVN